MVFGFLYGQHFDPNTNIGSLAGKVIFVTGGNSGLGAETIKQLAKHNPKEIWLAARTRNTAEETVTSVIKTTPEANIKIVELDLTSLSSVSNAAKTFLANSDRLDILFLNAGIAFNAPGLTKDGYELMFGTNHMGHALLTKLLMPTLDKTSQQPDADVRIVVISSYMHAFVRDKKLPFSAFKTDQSKVSTTQRYGISKLANVLFARALAQRYPRITTTSLHPGLVRTPITRGVNDRSKIASIALAGVGALFAKSVQDGTLNQLWCAAGSGVENGAYYNPVGKKTKLSGPAAQEQNVQDLWQWTEKELAEKGYHGDWP